MRCLCCNKEILSPDSYEEKVSWHRRCMKGFFGRAEIPELDITESQLEKLANSAVSKGLIVPGVQKKLSLHLETMDKRERLTIVDHPAGYILKPQSEDYPELPEAEFLIMKLAEIAGIKTVPNGLIMVADQYAYITKRIDRNGNKMYAMEDFCQLSNRLTEDKYKGSYEGCGRVIDRYSKNIGIDKTELFYRLIFCFVTGNSDMHLKNFSLIESSPRSRVFGLSAAYDLLPVNIILPNDREQMALTVNGKKRNIRKKDFLILAENLGLQQKTAEKLILQLLKKREMFGTEVGMSFMHDIRRQQLVELMTERMDTLDG